MICSWKWISKSYFMDVSRANLYAKWCMKLGAYEKRWWKYSQKCLSNNLYSVSNDTLQKKKTFFCKIIKIIRFWYRLQCFSFQIHEVVHGREFFLLTSVVFCKIVQEDLFLKSSRSNFSCGSPVPWNVFSYTSEIIFVKFKRK